MYWFNVYITKKIIIYYICYVIASIITSNLVKTCLVFNCCSFIKLSNLLFSIFSTILYKIVVSSSPAHLFSGVLFVNLLLISCNISFIVGSLTTTFSSSNWSGSFSCSSSCSKLLLNLLSNIFLFIKPFYWAVFHF